MSKRAASLLAWSMCALSLALTALSLFLLYLNYSHLGVHIWEYWLENTVIAVVYSSAGAIIAPHLPNHPIGWLFCTIGLLEALVGHFTGLYAIYTLLAAPGSLSGGEVAAWVTSWAWILSGIGLLCSYSFCSPLEGCRAAAGGGLQGSPWLWS